MLSIDTESVQPAQDKHKHTGASSHQGLFSASRCGVSEIEIRIIDITEKKPTKPSLLGYFKHSFKIGDSQRHKKKSSQFLNLVQFHMKSRVATVTLFLLHTKLWNSLELPWWLQTNLTRWLPCIAIGLLLLMCKGAQHALGLLILLASNKPSLFL